MKSQCRAPLPGSVHDSNAFVAEAKEAIEAKEATEATEAEPDMFAFVVEADDADDDSVWSSVSAPSSPEGVYSTRALPRGE